MKLHRASGKPDWEGIKLADATTWQKLAMQTGGTITPANLITVVGLALVLSGLIIVSEDHYFLGLVIVAIGRLCDLLDGMVAEATHTKSPLGEALDAGFDKLASAAALWTLAIIKIIPWEVAVLILIPNLVNSALTVYAKRRTITLHPSKYGKLFMAFSWASLLVFVLMTALGHRFHSSLAVVAYALLAICLAIGTKTATDYWRTATAK